MQIEINRNLNSNLSHENLYSKFLKRPIDFFLAIILLILLSPIFLIIAFLVRVKLGGPVIFKQKRPGLNEKIFTLYKFRTMTEERDEIGELLPESKRLLKFGRILRSTSLDELPELFNILMGNMSFIGPRPLLIQYLSRYNNYHKRRHLVRPGLSGLAQVNGRNNITWKEKFDLDIEYIDKISFFKDVKIIILTLKKVILKENINQNDEITMELFKG